MMKSLKYLLLTVAVLAAATLPAREYRVAAGDVAATLREAKPGDRIVIEDGIYNDLTLKWLGRGTEKKPLCIEAQTPGGDPPLSVPDSNASLPARLKRTVFPVCNIFQFHGIAPVLRPASGHISRKQQSNTNLFHFIDYFLALKPLTL